MYYTLEYYTVEKEKKWRALFGLLWNYIQSIFLKEKKKS